MRPPGPGPLGPATGSGSGPAGDPWAARSRRHRPAIDERLSSVAATAADELASIDEVLVPVGEELVAYVGTGGKRLRPLLVMTGHELAGGTPGDVLGPAVALELVHTWALLHDDLIDASDTRRARPTTHRAFAARHAHAGWAGAASDYGAAVAILLGDLVAVLADDEFERTGLSATTVDAGRRVFSHLRREVMAGQVLDVTAAADGSTGSERALKVATLKSGRYSVTRPLQLGAVLAEADADLVDALQGIGDALGVAFQLQDDLLGMLGDEHETGKPVAGDLREGKRTLLIAEAMARLAPGEAGRLGAALGRRDLDDDEAARVIASVRDSGAVEAVQDRVADLLSRARANLEQLPQSGPRDALFGFADLLAGRRR